MLILLQLLILLFYPYNTIENSKKRLSSYIDLILQIIFMKENKGKTRCLEVKVKKLRKEVTVNPILKDFAT